MLELNYFAIFAAAVAAFVIGAVWNGVFSDALTAARGDAAVAVEGMPLPQMLAEFARGLVIAAVLAVVFRIAGITEVWSALGLALLIWVGFQAALLSGAVIWEGMPFHLYAIHAGDALVKALVLGLVIGLWR